jgi:hypothetical protein
MFMDPIERYMYALFYNLQLGKGSLDLLHLSSSRSGEILRSTEPVPDRTRQDKGIEKKTTRVRNQMKKRNQLPQPFPVYYMSLNSTHKSKNLQEWST